METKVHRADLRTPPPATLSCLESEEELTQRLAAIYGPVITFPAPRIPVDTATSSCGCLPLSPSCQKSSCLKNDVNPKNEVETNVMVQDQEYSFYLFRSSGKSSPQKIILKQDQEHLGETGPDHKHGGFLVPQRNKSYYFSSMAFNGYKKQLLLSAVDGETVRQWSRKRAWGLEVPWRVQVLRAPKSTQISGTKEAPKVRQSTMESTIKSKLSMLSEVSEIRSQAQEKHASIRRKRPSKKNRIAMRKKQRAALATEEQLVRQKELKELAEKEKKIRRNRGKKIKRKIKKKREKGILEDINKV